MEGKESKRRRGAGDKSPSEDFHFPYPPRNRKKNVESWLQSSSSLSTEAKEGVSDPGESHRVFANFSLSAEAKEFIPRKFPVECNTYAPAGVLSGDLTVKKESKGKMPVGMANPESFPESLPLAEETDSDSFSSGVQLLEYHPSLEVQQTTRNNWQPPEQRYARLEVCTDGKVCFANGTVHFVIRLVNVPAELPLNARMLVAVVYTPSEKFINCRVWSDATCRVNAFQGAFEAKEEFGMYTLLVRMTVPGKHLAKFGRISNTGNGIIRGSAQLGVSRNYIEDIRNKCLKVKCEFVDKSSKAWSRRPESQGSPGLGQMEKSSGQPTPEVTSAVKSKLWGLACNLQDNNLLYSDRNANQVICVSPTGETVFKFGSGANVPESQRLNRPTGIAVDHIHNRLVICDKDNHRICFFSLDGKFISSFGGRGVQDGLFEYPWDVAVSQHGNIGVTDSQNKRIQFFDHFGNYMAKYSVFEVFPVGYRTQFDYPRGICFDSSGIKVYVTDFNLGNVICVPADVNGHYHLLSPRVLFCPEGITLDSSENLLVADSRHNCLRHMSDSGEHLSNIRYMKGEPLTYPVNVTTMAGGAVAVLSRNGIINIF